jgi:D-alanyl-D-alanine carboxypeptidase/D-alanyl-D-alanine-endopeptidase (penicillin-binding protein 4)
LRELVESVWSAGVREVRGNVEAVASRYAGDPYPDGWTLDDTNYGYGAPVSALTFNDNTVALILRPSETGELADVELRPATPHFVISNQVVTVAGKDEHIRLERPDASNELVLRGSIGDQADEWRVEVAVDTPAHWIAWQFAELLRERGITVRGQTGTRADACSCPLIAARESAPLSQVIQVVNKVSQNLHAEMLLREVAVARGNDGTLENGLRERQAFLNEAGVIPDGSRAVLADGSGLARHDLTTPDFTVALLQYMWERPEREIWLHSLPVGHIDGTLQRRFRGIAGAQRVHGKTGSLAHVATLSGYIEKRAGGWIAFSVMVNAAVGRDMQTRDFIDKLCAFFLDS